MDLLRDRHLDAVTRRKRQGGIDRVRALGDAGERRLDVRPRPAPGELLAEPMVAGQLRAARRDDVADAREAGERERVRARGDPDAGHLGEAAGHEPGLAVVAEPEAIRRSRSDRDDVLEGAAQLDAEDVRVRVQPELAPRQPGHDPIAERGVLGRDHRRRGQALGDLLGEVGPRERGDPARVDRAPRRATRVRDDLGHPQERPVLQALDDREHVRRRPGCAGRPARRSHAGARTARRG